MFIIGAANVFALILTVEQVPQNMSLWMTDHIDDKIVALLFINLIPLIVGTFMETAAAIFHPWSPSSCRLLELWH